MSEPFKLPVQPDRILPEILSTCLQIRAANEALAAINIEILSRLSGVDAEVISQRYDSHKADALLRYAFELQENSKLPDGT